MSPPHCGTCSSSTRFARRSGGSAARWPRCGPTTWARSRSASWCGARAPIPPAIDDVFFGCANQAGEDNRNVARMACCSPGCRSTVPGATVNRLCGSGMQAVIDGARAIAAGEADLVIAGGVESMSRAPLVMAKAREAFPRGDVVVHDTTLGWRFVNPRMEALHGTLALGETAELVAEQHGVTREAQDAFALDQPAALGGRARGRAVRRRAGRGADVPARKGAPRSVRHRRAPAPETTAADLAALPPAFRKQNGTVTAGNASGINDGAAAVLLASQAGLARLGAGAARSRASSRRRVAGVEPKLMGLGPIPATHEGARARRHRRRRPGSRSS